MENKTLPLGSVVTLKNGDGSQLLIVTRAAIIEEDGVEVYFDYGSVLIPQGIASPENGYFFNSENIEEIIFIGFENEAEKEFQVNYENMIDQSIYPKGKVKD
ncbi:TPA: DUF4176 domain-containing protein [Streptococcus agalactiae]|uniref:DUF4176 domain-containing protein n=1 Tax=Streptococcus agalactiae TaxID=1311 RepID=UPI0020066AC2|nr:DUF4176 domain-containing protein [Streptococcus agalactiae]MCC9786939.1 DUF4176 domain-containing protein [Streptococcus agalactiae]MCD0119649.1 DUF4176 domain-containing protein [Streptococcus agalactiae]MCK6300460.1 DUF4176 domain-containing protein [Streptococcus agalactiae]